jgi:hypothetical protein
MSPSKRYVLKFMGSDNCMLKYQTALLGFEPTISVGERPQTYALDLAATGTGSDLYEGYRKEHGISKAGCFRSQINGLRDTSSVGSAE